MFSLMMVIMRCETAITWGSAAVSLRTNAMSAASMALLLPAPPMAMPAVARLRVGASLMPSPTMRTGAPPSSKRSMARSLSSGRQSASTLQMPACLARHDGHHLGAAVGERPRFR